MPRGPPVDLAVSILDKGIIEGVAVLSALFEAPPLVTRGRAGPLVLPSCNGIAFGWGAMAILWGEVIGTGIVLPAGLAVLFTGICERLGMAVLLKGFALFGWGRGIGVDLARFTEDGATGLGIIFSLCA